MNSIESPFSTSIVTELAFLMVNTRPDPPNLEMMIYGEEDSRYNADHFTIHLPK